MLRVKLTAQGRTFHVGQRRRQGFAPQSQDRWPPVSFVNHASREIYFKIVYYGAGLSGNTTNLQWFFELTEG